MSNNSARNFPLNDFFETFLYILVIQSSITIMASKNISGRQIEIDQEPFSKEIDPME